MKRLNVKTVVREIKATDSGFVEDALRRIKDAIAPLITDDDLSVINGELVSRHRRPMTLDEIAMVAYVHLRSVRENDGYSPYERIIKYLANNDVTVDKAHVRQVTQMLLDIGVLEIVEMEDRKKHTCRRYRVPPDAAAILLTK